MSNGYRKPGPNSTPEECRRFVDEKYIKKSFSPAGYQDPVKEFVAAREKGTKPDFGWTKEQVQEKKETPQKQQQIQQVNGSGEVKYHRKKSMSLDKIPKKTHQYEDLLSADDDLLGGGNHPHSDTNDFGDFKEAQTHSASPVKKINFANFKKANNTTTETPQEQNHWAWDMSGVQQANDQTQSANNTQSNVQIQTQPQNQTDNKVDVMKLYSQPTNHQNHFMQGGWHSQGGWGTGNQNNFQMGNMQQNMYQGGMGFQNNFGGQQINPHMGQNFGMGYGNVGMGQNMGFNQIPGYGQQSNTGFVQAPTNKFF